MELIYGHDAAVAAWAASHFPFPADVPSDVVSIGVAEEGQLIGAACFTDYRRDLQGIEISVVAVTPRAIQRPVLRAVFGYPFDQLGCRWVAMHTPIENEAAIKLAKGVGFVQRGVDPHHYAHGKHRMRLTMLAAAWPRLLRRL
jgi:RimJ/RimL family protein N-acetyltransferase